MADDLEQQVGAGLIDRQVSQFIKDQDAGLTILFEFLFEAAGGLGGQQTVDGIHGGSEQDRMAFETDLVTQSDGQVGFSQTDAAQKD